MATLGINVSSLLITLIGMKDPGTILEQRMDANVQAVTIQGNSMLDTPLEDTRNLVVHASANQSPCDANFNILQALAQEMMKLLKGKTSVDQSDPSTTAYAHFACIAPSTFDSISSQTGVCCAVHNANGSWIVDTGASDHMTSNYALLSNCKPLHTPVSVTLPDGTLKLVAQTGQVHFNQFLTLNNVLHVPEFKHNLLSVGKLLSECNLCAVFYPDHCFFQDPSTKLIVAAGKMNSGLYFLHNTPTAESKFGNLLAAGHTFSEGLPHSNSTFCLSNKPACNVDVLHAWLGHTSYSKMQHIPICKDLLSTFSLCETYYH